MFRLIQQMSSRLSDTSSPKRRRPLQRQETPGPRVKACYRFENRPLQQVQSQDILVEKVTSSATVHLKFDPRRHCSEEKASSSSNDTVESTSGLLCKHPRSAGRFKLQREVVKARTRVSGFICHLSLAFFVFLGFPSVFWVALIHI